MERQFATCTVNGTLFGIDVLMVNEINRDLRITPVAQAPAEVRGLLNLRGQLVTVLDLAVRLGRPPTVLDRDSRCIVLKRSADLDACRRRGVLDDDTCRDLTGLLVDRIGDMVQVDAACVEPPPANLPEADAQLLAGTVRLEGRLLAVLRLAAVLAIAAAPDNRPENARQCA